MHPIARRGLELYAPRPPARHRSFITSLKGYGCVSLAIRGLKLRREGLLELLGREGKAFARTPYGATAVLLCRISLLLCERQLNRVWQS